MPADAAPGRKAADAAEAAVKLSDIPIDSTRAPEGPGPSLAALWQGQAGLWTRHHLTQRLEGAAQYAFYHGVRPFPPEFPAALGRMLGPVAGYIDRNRSYVAHMNRAIPRIRPDLDAAGQQALLARWWRNIGITHALFPSHEKLARPARVTVQGAERFAEADRLGNTIYLLVHLGSWEMLSHIFTRHHERPWVGIYQPQMSRFQNRLIFAGRRRHRFYVFPPSTQLPRRLIKLIEGGCNGAFFIDEVSEGQSRFPLWGRAVPSGSNVAFSLKLAHRLGARLQPGYLLREPQGRSSVHLLEPFSARTDLPRDVFVRRTTRTLSALFEPIIAEHLDQWYMLKELRL